MGQHFVTECSLASRVGNQLNGGVCLTACRPAREKSVTLGGERQPRKNGRFLRRFLVNFAEGCKLMEWDHGRPSLLSSGESQ